MKYDKDTYVKSNSLVQATVSNLTAQQNRLMAMLLTSYVNNFDENSIEDTITLSRYDIMNYLGLSDSGQTYRDINRTIRSFFQNSIVTWIDNEEKSQNTTALFSNVKINNYDQDGDSLVEFTWNPYIKPHISNMKKEYTILVTSNFLSLKSKKSQSLYEYFHSYVSQGYIKTSIEKLKEITQCTSSGYKSNYDFIRRGIKTPIKDINEKTDIMIEIIEEEKARVGKRMSTVALVFKITMQNAKKVWFNEYPDIRLTENEYNKLTQEFFINDIWIGKKLVNKLHEVKQKKPDSIHNDFKQLEKYYKAEVRKFEKESAAETPEEKTNVSQLELYQMLENLKNGKQ